MSSSSFESSEWYDSSSDETERRIRVIRERRELNNALSRELLAYAEGQSLGQGRRWRGPDQVRDREAAADLLMWDYFTEPCNYNDDIFERRFRMKKPLFLRIVGDLEREYPFFNRAEMLEEEKGYLLCKSVRRQFVKWHMGYPLTVWMTTWRWGSQPHVNAY